MALINTNNRNMATYLTTGNFSGLTKGTIITGSFSDLHATYIERDDLCVGQGDAQSPAPAFSVRWDPHLIDNLSSTVGPFNSPVSGGDNFNATYFVSAFDPSTNTQRLFNVLGANGVIQEISINNPTLLIDSNPWPKFNRQIPSDFISGQVGYWAQMDYPCRWLFFPGIDLAIVMATRLWIAGPVEKTNIIAAVTLSTGFGQPLGVPGRYAAGENEFNRGPVFDESDITFRGVQFIPDDDSIDAQPKGELMFWSKTTNPSGNDGRVYVKFVDFNPIGISGTPNRVHLRETLFSRVDLTLNTLPTGDPPSPLNGVPVSAGGMAHPNVFFGSSGDQRIHILGSDGISIGNTIDVQASKAAIAALISTPSQKVDPTTNRLVTYQSEVRGNLGEEIANAAVTFTLERLSTEGEVLATTPTPGETVVVDNFPIDRSIEFPAGFQVLEDGSPLTESTHYTVTEATGSINFIGPKPEVGKVYTINYAHTAAPATPAHGNLIDAAIFSNIDGVAQARVSYPDDDTLAGHLDQLEAETPT